jgi:GT2 family glycosyltransferase
MMAQDSPITALIVTYAPDAKVLGDCVQSLRRQTPRPKIIIADNRSTSDASHKVALSFEMDECRVFAFDRNHGFGGAINRVLPEIDTRYLLISNFDIIYDSNYLASALGYLESCEKDVVGIAGKTLFYPPDGDSRWPGRGPGDPSLENGRGTGAVIDNTGTLVNGLMLAYNRGVGQIDIGQFDQRDRPMGACFAAFVGRRDAFRPISEGGVGLLDAGYFMYYEDIDWCYRANALGFRIMYEPAAVAWHHHSLTTRGLPLFFKYHLIQRNLYRTIMKNMRFRTVVKLWAMHARLHIRRARIEKQFGPVTTKILLETLAWMPAGLVKRIPIQSRRAVSDSDIINLSIGEEGHLDDVALRPRADWRNPAASLERLARIYPDDPACELLPQITAFTEGGTGEEERGFMEAARGKCPGLVPLIEEILSSEGIESRK